MPELLRVLLVDDSEDDALLLVEELRKGGYAPDYIRVDTGEAMRQALATASWDLVLADYSMPQFSGPAALKVLHENGQDVPYIVVSGMVSEQQAIDMMRQGAHDFILKQSLARLVPAVHRELQEAQMRQERREALRALRASEAKYRTLFCVEPDAVLLIDPETFAVIEANDAAQRLYGYTSEEFQTRSILELSADPELTIAAIRETINLHTYHGQQAHRTKDGTDFPTEVTARRFVYEQHQMLFVTVRDITARQQARDALEREQAFLASAIELLPFPIIFNTPSGEVIRANQASYRFFGDLWVSAWWSRQLLYPISHEAIPRADWPMTRAARGEVVSPVEGILVLPEGREVDVLAVAAPVYVRDTLMATVVAFMDITPIKEADRAKNRFLAVLSHDLRTPLTNILGWAKLARESPELLDESLEVILRNAEAQRRMLERLLDVSRLLHGKFDLQREPVDLRQVVDDAIHSLQLAAEERQVTIERQESPAPLPVVGDKKRLREAIESVLENAIRFSNLGDAIKVQEKRIEATAEITIRDTGRGIPPAMLPHVFELFQVSPEVARTGGGLGLGLPLTKAIVEHHGGQIAITSPGEGQGSTVTIMLPLV